MRYGWIPDRGDVRDCLYAMPSVLSEGTLPPSVDLTSHPTYPGVYNQLNTNSCTGNAWAYAVQHCLIKQGLPVFLPSRLFGYYNGRDLEGTAGTDCGAMIRDVIKGGASKGACTESEWPFDPGTVTERPSPQCYQDALKDIETQYSRLAPSLPLLKSCLAEGFPFIFGMSVYESFESQEVARTGIVGMPQPGERMIGGHAIACVGYDDSSERFLIRNSWGEQWGMPSRPGHFTLPYGFVLNDDYANDFWTIRLIKGA